MKLRAKILLLLLGVVLPVMLLFAGFGISFFNNSLKKESAKNHNIMYTLFLPNIASYLWEFDTDGVKSILSSIIENNYAKNVSVYDMDNTLILGLRKNFQTDTLEEIKSSNLAEFNISKETLETYGKSIKDRQNLGLLELKNLSDDSTVMGLLSHKKIESNFPDLIGYVVFTYSNTTIKKLITKAVFIILFMCFFIAFILIAIISIMLRKVLIKRIIQINNASLVIAMGRKKIISESDSNDEIAELIKNFNIMANQIYQNQENLKLIGEEGIKISSCLDINSMVKQIQASLNKISNQIIDFNFYISTQILNEDVKKQGYVQMIFENGNYRYIQTNMIEFGHENDIVEGMRKIFIYNNISGDISAIIELQEIKNKQKTLSFKVEEKLYTSLQALQLSIASALSTMKLIHEQKNQLRLIGEQETAKLVQKNLLPSSELKIISSFEVIGHFEPAAECAGDWWYTYELSGNRLLLLLGDVTGHGTGSAILTAVVKGYCDSLNKFPNLRAADILSELDLIVFNVGKGERVMTMFAAILDPNTKSIEYSNASHNFPFLLKASQSPVNASKLIVHGNPLGFKMKNTSNRKFINKVSQIQTNDLILIFSDGLVEAENTSGENFSDKSLKIILEQEKDKSIQEIKKIILEKFREFIKNTNLADDVTFLLCRIK